MVTKKQVKTEKELLIDINTKLDKLIGITVIQNMKSPDDKIYMLKGLGFKETEIKLFVIVKGRIRDCEGWKRK